MKNAIIAIINRIKKKTATEKEFKPCHIGGPLEPPDKYDLCSDPEQYYDDLLKYRGH